MIYNYILVYYFMERQKEKQRICNLLKDYFKVKAQGYNIVLVFLYGSWAAGLAGKDSDIDIAIMIEGEKSEEEIFSTINSITLELLDNLKRDITILYIDNDISKPLLHYNAIVKGIPVYISDFYRYVDVWLKAIDAMEDFSIFGIKWKLEVTEKRMKDLYNAV